MAAILIFCQICHKTMVFAFYFVICFLLTIYFSKYLQFPLNIITHLEGFGEKTYEKTCRFYNTFSKSSSICSHFRSFRIWIFFSKISWPNLMSIFFTFHRFYEKTYGKTYQFYGLFPNVLSLCARSQNFVIWKFFLKKCQLFQYFNNL